MNYYAPEQGKLGKHRDDTEDDRTAPIITISLGDDCVFGIGGANYEEACEYLVLSSGDCVVMSGASRMFYHARRGDRRQFLRVTRWRWSHQLDRQTG